MAATPLRAHVTARTPHCPIAAVVSLVVGVVASVCLWGAQPAFAHTGFDSSTPAEAAVVDQPVDVVTIVFTGEANPVGEEFVALNADGVVQEPVSVETLDNRSFTVRFDPPLAGGDIGIRWNVQAADAHPIEGSFSFTVTAAVPTTASATTAPLTTATPAVTAAADSSAVEQPTPTDQLAPAAAAVEDGSLPPSSADGVVEGAPTQSLDEFLAVDGSTPGESTATVGRVVGFLGVTVGLGALAFLATALRGRRDEIRHMVTAVRALGAVIAVGAVIEYAGVSRIGGQSLTSTWSSAAGFATLLRIIGGVALAVGLSGAVARVAVTDRARSLSAATVDALPATARQPWEGGPVVRWTPDARSWPALGGVVLVLASFWFDGHTVTKGFRPLHALVNSVHVAAGAVWVGGVVAMAAVVWSRHRSRRPMRVAELVLRFSKVATIALGAVVVAGGIMAFLVLDSFGELTGTPWGKILLLKTAAVTLAALGGAYNHFRLLPALESDPDSPRLLDELRSTVTAEAILLVFVVSVTAWLVAAAS